MSCFPIFILLFLFPFSKSDDQLTQGKPLSPGDILISKDGVFALGFFSPANSNKSLYVGIWFYNIPESSRAIVWVANRDNPATTASPAALAISVKSDLVLSDSGGHTLWMTKNNVTADEDARASAVLLDTGNLVLRSPNGTVIWQSFDHPTDTILPGMRFLLSYKGRVMGRLVAWKGPDDPSVGDFSFGLDPDLGMQIVTWHGAKLYCRISVWNGASVSGGTYPGNSSSVVYQTIVNTGDRFYLMYSISDDSPYARIMLDYTGTMSLLTWNSYSSSWIATSERPSGGYGVYGSCGPFGYSDFTGATPTCQCLDGFEPDPMNSSRVCRRVEALKCGSKNHFLRLSGMKVPDRFLHIRNRSFDQCAAECSRNCSCTAYAYANLSSAGTLGDQTRCLVWTGELVDTWKTNNYAFFSESSSRDKYKDTREVVLGDSSSQE
uniref:non-specific serine/threonine protein kinase n=1 Tax=Aegilops tauschii subsp. strangulata TaxID=200361 RepID=A0A453DBN0_AEGTS